MNNCQNCNNETSNPKYCSKSCSAQYNNRLKPKRVAKARLCKVCGIDTKSTWKKVRTVCDTCLSNVNQTKSDFTDKRSYQIHSVIRYRARRMYISSGKPLECSNCKYNKHVEVCHIKAIKDFDKNTKINDINNINNLIALCPNCHWELDNNLLSLP